MIDCDGNTIGLGDKFIYRFGKTNQRVGEVFDWVGTHMIWWEDYGLTSVEYFYNSEKDTPLLKKIKPKNGE